MDKRCEILARDTVYDGFLRVDRYRLRHSLYSGGTSRELVRERVERLRAAAILLYDPDADRVVMIEQFRIGAHEAGVGAWLLETVGGYVPPDESPEQVARREAMEEAGCEVREIEPIGEFYLSPGTSVERITLYCGRVQAPTGGALHGLDHEGEDIRVEVLPADAAIAELFTGRIDSTTGIITLQWLAAHRARLRTAWGRRAGDR
ncbi:MAG: NUDIX domain-containing protein [Gammaproteobacteria bacterium]|jgi:ADP-ribose pyrophosphatase|nr:NUDIX domain-containing protein [Gammaproteobacteria bacterium]